MPAYPAAWEPPLLAYLNRIRPATVFLRGEKHATHY